MSQQNIQNLVDNITYLNITKQLIKNAIINKGQEITATTPFRNYVEKISNITTGDNSNSYLFTNITEMNSFTANEGDYGIIWYEKAEGVKTYGNYTNLYPMPNMITFDNEVTSWTNGMTSNNAANRLTYNVGPVYIRINHTDSKYASHDTVYRYSSADNKIYHLDKLDSDPAENISNLKVVILSNLYNPILEKLLISNFSSDFNGIYTYNNKWEPANTQLNSVVSNILGPRTAFVNSKITGNLFGNTINGLNNLDVLNYYNNINPVYSNIQPMNNFVNTSNLFREYHNIQYIPNIKSTNLYRTFYNCYNLVQVNIETNPNTYTDASDLFFRCNNLSSVEGNLYVTGINNLFSNCKSLTTIPNIAIRSNIINNAFVNCHSLTDLSRLNISNVDTIRNSFCNGYINTNILNDLDFSNVNNLVGLFMNFMPTSYNINDINIQKISSLNCNNLIDISYLYYYCYNITSIPNFITNNVKNMSHMFYYCHNLTTIPNFNTINVTNMHSLLYYCNNITSIPNLNTSNVIDMAYMVRNCALITSIPNFNTINVTNMAYMFFNCNKITSIPNFDTRNVIDMAEMFWNCFAMTKTPTLNTSKVTNMAYMFDNCVKITSVSSYDTSNVINMYEMFWNCYNLTTVPQYNTSKVDIMSAMFFNCNKLTTASIQNIINMILNSNITAASYKNLNNTNSSSPFYNTNITSSKYSNRTSELTAAGWTY